MDDVKFTQDDLLFMQSLGITEGQVRQHIELFRKSSCFVNLSKPCTTADGIRKIAHDEIERYLRAHQEAVADGRFIKFVPASGAATRMFETLCHFYNQPDPLTLRNVAALAQSGNAVATDLLEFFESLSELALFDDLKIVMAKDGLHPNALIERDQLREILGYVLTESGLNCKNIPKGLLKFHRYPSACRTAFEEHLVEAAHYVRDRNGLCRVHFTVSPEHHETFRSLFGKMAPVYEQDHRVRYDVTFSYQKKSLDTIAVDAHNRPFRDETGLLVFRPAGHGALLDNLNDIAGEFIYIKNIDNVVLDSHKEATYLWKKVLGGMLVYTVAKIHGYLHRLHGSAGTNILDEALTYARDALLIHFPEGFRSWSDSDRREFLIQRFNRPVRVCGVVRNVGEPGGAPFWIRNPEGHLTPQIVEKAQVDMQSPHQKEIWLSSTHFNPVDLVCALRDFKGNPFDLKDFADHSAVFISTKSNGGTPIKALELPGLWNGAMAHWITIFVEVPRATFNPVKKINDLLKPEHQMDGKRRKLGRR